MWGFFLVIGCYLLEVASIVGFGAYLAWKEWRDSHTPNYDYKCRNCGHIQTDVLVPISKTLVNCPSCFYGDAMERVWLQGKANGVIDDSIPGGLWIKNGLCHEDGSPKRYDSHSEIRRAEQRTGFVNKVRHVGGKGSDKSKHTTRWY